MSTWGARTVQKSVRSDNQADSMSNKLTVVWVSSLWQIPALHTQESVAILAHRGNVALHSQCYHPSNSC